MSAGAGNADLLRVLLVNDRPPGRGGGVEIHLSRLANGLEQLGHAVSYCTTPHSRRGLQRARDLWDPAAAAALEEAAKGCDVVHIHNFLRELSPAVLRIATSVATVVTVHDHRLFASDRPARAMGLVGHLEAGLHDVAAAATGRLATFLIRRNVHRLIAASDELAVALARRGMASRVIHPFAPSDSMAWSAPAGSTVLYAGRLARSKGLQVLIEAASGLPPDLDVHVVLAGSGPDAAALRALVPAQARARFSFIGEVGHDLIVELLRSCRVACLPSIDVEGWPLFVVEAMTVGRPVVATDHSSLRSMLGNGERGELVPVGDVLALRTALERLLRDHERASLLGAAGRQFAEQELSSGESLAQIVAIYREAMVG